MLLSFNDSEGSWLEEVGETSLIVQMLIIRVVLANEKFQAFISTCSQKGEYNVLLLHSFLVKTYINSQSYYSRSLVVLLVAKLK